MRPKLRRAARHLAAAVAVFLGCDDPTSDPAGTPLPRAPLTDDDAGAAAAAAVPGLGLRRLTRAQYENAVRTLLGGAATFSPDLSEVKVSLQAAQVEYTTEAATRAGFSAVDVDALFDSAMATVGPLFADSAKRAALVGCTPAAADDACARAFVAKLAHRAFRRPVEDAEIGRYLTLSADAAKGLGGDPWQGLAHAVAAILQAPSLLYVDEVGEPDPANDGRTRYTSLEMGTRLALALTGTLPDETLLAAAESGALTGADAVRAQASRLLATDAARTNLVSSFFQEFFNLGAMEGVGKDTTVFPQWNAALGASMVEELRRTLDDGVFGADLDFASMLTRRVTFVDAPLAAVYGLPAPSGPGFQKVTIPDNWARVGLLGAGAFLAINAKPARTSPTLRGKFIAERLLCTPIAPPPANVPELDREDAGSAPQTLRQRMEAHGKNPACSGCHKVMDPPGFGLEGFDAIGAFRETDNGLPIDATGTLDGVSFDGPPALAKALAQLPRVSACLSQQAFRYLAARTAAPGALDDVTRKAGGHVRALVLELVTSDAFRFTTK
jgi:Protein of unknown function (DUF1588)/Protein of unknown function (DUF1592)/Protein of unknown function (DUF1595)/Protein of unknown function (DUF1585)